MIEIFRLALAGSLDCRGVLADDKLISFMLTPHPIPLWDYIGRPLLGGIFLGLLYLQWRFALRRQHFSMLRRLVRNFILSIPGFAIVRLAMLPIPLAVAVWAQDCHFGLLNWLQLPTWLATVATFALMDYAYWWWHYANHMVPLFWRFHNVHHTDLDLDVSTAARFHFGEMLFSVGFLSLAVILFGIAPIMLLVFFITFEGATLFHHSNWRLPIKVERTLNLIIVTPRMHGIHHSIVQRETNSNWGTIFCWWDKLHRTMRRDIPQDAVAIGVAAYRDEQELTLGKLFALPFGKQREWRLPTGEQPERMPHQADELAE
jgi:sterol desaturase/sphingolipid hydroxylase (fatty acid hydroxylase superfamily)